MMLVQCKKVEFETRIGPPGNSELTQALHHSNKPSMKPTLSFLLLMLCSSFCAASTVPYDLGKEEYEHDVIWSFDGCSTHRLMQNSGIPKVFNGNVYTVIIAPGLHPRVVKVPLDGSASRVEPLQRNPDYTIGDDGHQYFTLGIDSKGYVHVVGGMHNSKEIKHWRSVRPEDISEFVFASGKDGPSGNSFTYPFLTTDLKGTLFHHARITRNDKGCNARGLSVLDTESQTWSMIGADIPSKDGGLRNRPVTLWEDDTRAVTTTYSAPELRMVFDSKNRMHLAFGILNRTMEKDGKYSNTDVLYARSDDGGKTITKSNGEPIKWPVRAEEGPHQGEIAYSEPDGPPPWLDKGDLSLVTDWQNAPIISTTSHKSGRHVLRLEDGSWVPYGNDGIGELLGHDVRGVLSSRLNNGDILRFWDPGNTRRVALPHRIRRIDAEYLRDTGDLIYTAPPADNDARHRETGIAGSARQTRPRQSRPTRRPRGCP